MSALQCLPLLYLRAKLFWCSKVQNNACCLDQTCKDVVPSCSLISLSPCSCLACFFDIPSFCMVSCLADFVVQISLLLIICWVAYQASLKHSYMLHCFFCCRFEGCLACTASHGNEEEHSAAESARGIAVCSSPAWH